MNFQTFLQTNAEFADFTDEQLVLLEKSMRVDEYPADHIFFEEGTPGKDIYLIVDGQVCVSHRQGRKSGAFEIKDLQPGEWFGLVSVLESGKHEATCTAKTKVTVASLPKSAFNLLYNSNVELAHKIQKLISHQVIRDHRALLLLIRKTMATLDNTDNKQKVLQTIHMQYQGPERRTKRKASLS